MLENQKILTLIHSSVSSSRCPTFQYFGQAYKFSEKMYILTLHLIQIDMDPQTQPLTKQNKTIILLNISGESVITVKIVFRKASFYHKRKGSRSRIHERTISLKFLSIISDLRFPYMYNVFFVYITKRFQTTSAQGGGGGG
jgi:hypothetical protein